MNFLANTLWLCGVFIAHNEAHYIKMGLIDGPLQPFVNFLSRLIISDDRNTKPHSVNVFSQSPNRDTNLNERQDEYVEVHLDQPNPYLQPNNDANERDLIQARSNSLQPNAILPNNYNNGRGQLEIPSQRYHPRSNAIPNDMEAQLQDRLAHFHARLNPYFHNRNHPYISNYENAGDQLQVPSKSYQPHINGIPNKSEGHPQLLNRNSHNQMDPNIYPNHKPYNNNDNNNERDQLHVPSNNYSPQSNEDPNRSKDQPRVPGAYFQDQRNPNSDTNIYPHTYNQNFVNIAVPDKTKGLNTEVLNNSSKMQSDDANSKTKAGDQLQPQPSLNKNDDKIFDDIHSLLQVPLKRGSSLLNGMHNIYSRDRGQRQRLNSHPNKETDSNKQMEQTNINVNLDNNNYYNRR